MNLKALMLVVMMLSTVSMESYVPQTIGRSIRY